MQLNRKVRQRAGEEEAGDEDEEDPEIYAEDNASAEIGPAMMRSRML